MRNKFLAAIVAACVVASGGWIESAHGEEIPAEAKALHAKLTAKLRPSLRTWIDAEVKKLRLNPRATDATVLADAKAISNMGLGDGDIEAICFIVLMEATKDMDKDLKAIMDEVKAMNDAKKKQREQLSQMNSNLAKINGGAKVVPGNRDIKPSTGTTVTPHAGHVQPALPQLGLSNVGTVRVMPSAQSNTEKAETDKVKDKLDSMSEMNEMTSLRLQMMMDRSSKFISTLSNIMKKISSTQDTIVQNLK